MVKKREKYDWSLPEGLRPDVDPHTKVKHQVIEKYMYRYLETVMKNARIPELKWSLVDGFCGGGVYNDLADGSAQLWYGSPFKLLDVPQKVENEINIGREKPRKIHTFTYLVDKEPLHVDYLKFQLQRRDFERRFDSDIFFFSDGFQGVYKKIIGDIKQKNSSERSFFLLDQYAYKDVPMALIKEIFTSLKSPEVLLTFNSDSLITYLSDTDLSKNILSGLDLGGSVDLESLVYDKHFTGWRSMIQTQLTKGILASSGARYITPFFVKPFKNNSWSYWLVHLSNTLKANDVMKDIHWDMGNFFSHALNPGVFSFAGYNANFDVSLTNQFQIDFEQDHSFNDVGREKCSTELGEYIVRDVWERGGPVCVNNVLDSYANNTMANFEVFKESIDQAIRCGDILACDKNQQAQRRKASSLKPTDVLKRSPQKFFSF